MTIQKVLHRTFFYYNYFFNDIQGGSTCSFLSLKSNVFLFFYIFQSGVKAKKATHVPYRDSVLTWLLKVTSMLFCVFILHLT